MNFKLILIGLLLVLFSTQAFALTTNDSNYSSGVYNGGFENAPVYVADTNTNGRWIDGTQTGSTTDTNYGWYVAGTFSGGFFVDFNSITKKSGNYSMELKNNGSNVQVRNIAYTSPLILNNNFNLIKIKPLTKYKLSAWIKSDNASSNACYFQFPQRTILNATATGTISSSKLSGTTDWTYTSIELTSNANSYYTFIVLYNDYSDSNGSCFFDDVRLEEVGSTNLSGQVSGRPSILVTGVSDFNAIDQADTNNSNTMGFGTTNTQAISFQFTPTQNRFSGFVFQRAQNTGTYTGNVTITLEKDDGSNNPDGNVLASHYFTNAQWEALNPNVDQTVYLPYIIDANGTNKYHVKFYSDTSDGSNYTRLRVDTRTGYSGGVLRTMSDANVWSSHTSDGYFKTLFEKQSSAFDLNVCSSGDSVCESKTYDIDFLEDGETFTINPSDAPLFYSGDNNVYFMMHSDSDYNNKTPSMTAKLTYTFDKPTTTFSSSQVTGTTDQNITLTCEAINGCKAINYNVDSLGWNTITRVDNCDDCNVYYGTGGYEIPYSDTTNVKVDHTWSFGFNTFNSSANQQIISQNTSSQFHIQSFHLDAGKLYYKIYANPTSYVDIEITTIDSNTPYYVVASIDFSGTSKIYVNNVEKWSQSLGTFAYGGTVGNYNTLIASTLNGIIYDVNITNTALNASQAETMYNYLSRPRRINSPINFLYSGAGDHNIQYFSTDNADNNETIKTSYFTTYGNGRFYFKDENSGSDLTGVQVNFNGVDYDSGANNYIDFNFQEITTNNYLFTFTKTGYETRYYKVDLNKFTDLNINFMMIPKMENVGNVQLTVYDADGLTTVPNNYVTVKKEEYVVGRLKTDPYANVSFVLNEVDTNYTFQIEGKYDTNMGNVLILRPKKEKQPQPEIIDDWTITLTTSNAETQYDINTNSKAILIIPNRSTYYYAKIDTNSGEYYARTYTLAVRGDRDGLTYTVQPYLIHENDDSSSFKITLKERYTGRKIPRGLIKIYTTETGNTQIATILTDDSAEIDIYLLKNTTYWISAEDSLGTQLLFYGKTRTMRNTIFGQDITLKCDYTINRGGITQISMYPIQKVVDINTTVAISIDTIWNNVSWWNPETNQIEIKTINDSDIDILVYKDGIYNESLGLLNGKLDTNNNLGYNLTHTFVLNEYGKDYNILVYVNGTLTKQFYIETITLARKNEIYGLAGTETIIQWLAIVIIITLAIIIGAITGYGLETLFLLSIIMVLAGIGTIQIIIVAIMGVIYFLMPFIRDYFKE